MTDQRPKYGEYATAEEQRRLAGLPPVERVPDAAAPAVPVVQAPPAASVQAADPAATARRSQIDRIATIALLAYGLINVIASAASYLDLPRVMNETMRILGVEGEFTNFAQGRLWGTIAAVVLIAGWAITAALSSSRLRRGMLTWWVPRVGAVATMLVVMICITVPMLGDPAFLSHLSTPGTL